MNSEGEPLDFPSSSMQLAGWLQVWRHDGGIKTVAAHRARAERKRITATNPEIILEWRERLADTNPWANNQRVTTGCPNVMNIANP